MSETKSLRETILENIVNATTQEQALQALRSVLDALHINQDYNELYRIGEDLKVFSAKIYDIQKKHLELPTPRNHQDLQQMRATVGFYHREIVDKFVYIVTKLKILIEEGEDNMKEEAMSYMDEHPEEFEGMTKSTKRQFLGRTPQFKAWINLRAESYANYKYMDGILASIEKFLDTLASELRGLDLVEKNNVK